MPKKKIGGDQEKPGVSLETAIPNKSDAPPDERYYDVDEVKEMFGMSWPTIKGRMKDGLFPRAYWHNNKWNWRYSELLKHMGTQPVWPNKPPKKPKK